MSPRMTITGAIKKVLEDEGKPLAAADIYQHIVARGYYAFLAEEPFRVVVSTLRKHCRELDFPSASPTKLFSLNSNNTFSLLGSPIKQSKGSSSRAVGRHLGLTAIRKLYADYQEQTRADILANIRRLDPYTFEHFSSGLLDAYGFTNTVVTRKTKDGGIDGHGRLKVGLSHMNVAFQSKRYTKQNVSRPEFDAFRGAIQGKFDQGIIFTTSGFVGGVEAESFRPGAVPIVLIPGTEIVNIMIEKGFGVEVEHVPVYTYALDMSLENGK